HGWPPASHPSQVAPGSWGLILLNRPVVFWQGVTWALETRHMRIEDLTADSVYTLQTLMDRANMALPAAVIGVPNDDVARIMRALQHVYGTATIPGHIALLEVDHLLDVADGYHRLAAYFLRRRIMTTDQSTGKPNDGGQTPRLQQQVWIGRSP